MQMWTRVDVGINVPATDTSQKRERERERMRGKCTHTCAAFFRTASQGCCVCHVDRAHLASVRKTVIVVDIVTVHDLAAVAAHLCRNECHGALHDFCVDLALGEHSSAVESQRSRSRRRQRGCTPQERGRTAQVSGCSMDPGHHYKEGRHMRARARARTHLSCANLIWDPSN